MMQAITLLFLVMDPLGNIPFFMTSLKKVAPERRQWVIARELLIALAIMVAFLFAGQGLLTLLQVSKEALTAAGGIILMLIAVRMVFPTPETTLEEVSLAQEPFIVPLAVPYTAGPSLLATEVLLMSQEPSRWMTWLGAVLAAWGMSSVILFLSGYLERILGERVLLALERLMGMILVLISTQMIFTGIREFFELG
ncbi:MULTISPECIES: MarC family protein [unclassified Luteococcus]|uniref:MarC family protein n=1 Tax=unclassified Luteococcus TaxID=2639923 RepID=UPI00313C3950